MTSSPPHAPTTDTEPHPTDVTLGLLDKALDPRRIASGNQGTTSHDFDGAT